MCLSAIAWSGFKNVYYFFSHEESRDEFQIPHDLNILKELFNVNPGGYNKSNAFLNCESIIELINNKIHNPVIIGRKYTDLSQEQLQLSASSDFGALLLDGLGDGIFIAAENCGSDQSVNSLAFGILQAC